MAKKKGLASLVKAPRNTTIKGQPHMLAYITGSEADALKRLGGSGDPGPMGIPAFFFDFDEGGVTGEGKDDVDSKDLSSGPSFDDGGDEDYDPPSVVTGSANINVSPDPERDDEVVSALSDNFLDKQGRADLNELAKQASSYFGTQNEPNKLTSFIAGSPLNRILGLISSKKGVPSRFDLTKTRAGLARGPLGAMQMGIQQGGKLVTDSQGNQFVEMPDGKRIGQTIMSSDNGGPSEPLGRGSGGLDAGETVTPAVTPDAYYQRGVGTQTMDLADSAQRDAFLAGLYGTTPSPIGSRLDREKGLLYLPDGTVVDIRTGKKIKEPRISGLDIFKPLQTYVR